MTGHFHGCLNRMALFTALLLAGLIVFHADFFAMATSNILLNGAIIGTALFGIILCFIEIFALLPEYKWLRSYISGARNVAVPPRLLRPAGILLCTRPRNITPNDAAQILDMIYNRFEDTRETVRYVTNLLIFLGLLGTFWGLIVTVGGFAELIAGLDFADESVLDLMQRGLSVPLGGMATAFTSSLLGLGGSLSVGFLGLQVQLAQNAIYRQMEDYLSAHASVGMDDAINIARVLKRMPQK